MILIKLTCIGALAGTPFASAFRQEARPPKIVAQIGGTSVSEDQLLKEAAGDLVPLEMQRRQILERHLSRLIAEKVLDLEAASRRIDGDELIKQEVEAKVVEPPVEELDRIYEASKARAKNPREKLIPKIRESLIQQQKQKLYARLVEELKTKYGVKTFLDPFRIDIETKGYPSQGPATASITIVEFTDFECPSCSRMSLILKTLRDKYADSVRLVMRPFPLPQIHPNAVKAAEACYCAEDQGKFWDLHDIMFADQKNLSVPDLSKKGRAIGLDVKSFDECLSSGKYAERVKKDIESGLAAGVTSTPTLFVNGRPIRSAYPSQEIMKVIEDELARAR